MTNCYTTDQDREFALLCLIDKMASTSENQLSVASSAMDELRNIYLDDSGERNGFQHSCSAISRVLLFGMLGDKADILPSGYGCRAIRADEVFRIVLKEVKREENSSLAEVVATLCDHVSLEAVRASFLSEAASKQEEKLDTESSGLFSSMSTLRSNVDDASRKYDSISKKMDGAQRDSVSILGIFSAVVIAVSTGGGFFASSFQLSADLGVSAFAFCVALVGLVEFNVMFALFTFIFRVIKDADNWGVMSKKAFATINAVLSMICFAFFVLASLSDAEPVIRALFELAE